MLRLGRLAHRRVPLLPICIRNYTGAAGAPIGQRRRRPLGAPRRPGAGGLSDWGGVPPSEMISALRHCHWQGRGIRHKTAAAPAGTSESALITGIPNPRRGYRRIFRDAGRSACHGCHSDSESERGLCQRRCWPGPVVHTVATQSHCQCQCQCQQRGPGPVTRPVPPLRPTRRERSPARFPIAGPGAHAQGRC